MNFCMNYTLRAMSVSGYLRPSVQGRITEWHGRLSVRPIPAHNFGKRKVTETSNLVQNILPCVRNWRPNFPAERSKVKVALAGSF